MDSFRDQKMCAKTVATLRSEQTSRKVAFSATTLNLPIPPFFWNSSVASLRAIYDEAEKADMDAVRQIIPTRLKAKISHELSFPIGAEKLSSALLGVPQFMKLSLHFKGDRWRLVRFRRFAASALSTSAVVPT
jgi:hypothetical protein